MRRRARRRDNAATDLSSTLQQLADLADIRGASSEAAALRQRSASIEWRVTEIARGGGEVALRAARATVPFLIRRLLELPALTTQDAARLVREQDVLTMLDLEVGLADGRIATTLGAHSASRLTAAAAALGTEVRLRPLGRAIDLTDAFTRVIAASGIATDVKAAGDVRRFEPLVRDLIVVASATDPNAALDAICAAVPADDVLHRGRRRAVLRHENGEIDVRLAPPDDYGTVLFTATGSRAHVEAVAARSRRPTPKAREEDIYRDAGLDWIAPELRHASGEIEAAATRTLPRLVERADIRGDLHMHSRYSDGRDTIATVVAAAVSLGYEYIAITDHSQSSAASRNLRLDEIGPQREEIAQVQARFPQIAILHGVEVDIMPDGSLDFDDEVLARFDIVLASLHDAAGHDGGRLTRRCLAAIRHPLVNVITHPANHLVGRRGGYPLDYDAVYAAAAETGTALEVDGAPTHLDLDGEHARAAVAAGATLVIDSDCHRSELLARQMQMGLGTARRGWVEPRQVLNTRPLADVREFIAAKRRRRG